MEIPVKVKASTKDEDKAHEVKGAIRETAGQVTDNPKLEAKGHHERWSVFPADHNRKGLGTAVDPCYGCEVHILKLSR